MYLRNFLFDAREKEKKKNEESEEGRDAVAEIEALIDLVAIAFQDGDAELLEDCLGSKKIHIALRARGEEAGFKGRPQVRFMFAKLFDERQTRGFLADRYSIDLADDGQTAFFRATWTYIVLDEDDIVTEHLRFRVERSSAGWRLFEILAGAR